MRMRCGSTITYAAMQHCANVQNLALCTFVGQREHLIGRIIQLLQCNMNPASGSSVPRPGEPASMKPAEGDPRAIPRPAQLAWQARPRSGGHAGPSCRAGQGRDVASRQFTRYRTASSTWPAFAGSRPSRCSSWPRAGGVCAGSRAASALHEGHLIQRGSKEEAEAPLEWSRSSLETSRAAFAAGRSSYIVVPSRSGGA